MMSLRMVASNSSTTICSTKSKHFSQSLSSPDPEDQDPHQSKLIPTVTGALVDSRHLILHPTSHINQDQSDEIGGGPSQGMLNTTSTAEEIVLPFDGVVPTDPTQRYQVELSITNGLSDYTDEIKQHCMTLASGIRNENNRQEKFTAIIHNCALLGFDRVKARLLEFLENRLRKPGNRAIPATWEMTDAGHVFDALQTIRDRSEDSMIHQAYGQMKFFSLIEEQSTVKAPYRVVLNGLAQKQAGSDKELEQWKDRYFRQYTSGRRWLEVSEWFEGTGVALIFVIAGEFYSNPCAKILTSSVGISRSDVGQDWTDFQRCCLLYISTYLFAIKDLVRTLGEDALSTYCRDGHLSREAIEEIDGVDGYFGDQSGLREIETESND